MKLGILDSMEITPIDYDKYIDWSKMELIEGDESIGRNASDGSKIYGLPKIPELFETHCFSGNEVVINFDLPNDKVHLVYDYLKSLKLDLIYTDQLNQYELINPVYELTDNNLRVTLGIKK